MTSIIKKKEAAVISKEIIVRNIAEEVNTNDQAEECFRIKKYSSFKEKDVSICEFIKRNYEERKKQGKCLIKVCEKIMNGVKGQLYSHQANDEVIQISQKKIKKNGV